MSPWRATVGLLLCLQAVPVLAEEPRPGPAEIGRLVQQLGSRKFRVRELASRRLEAIGPPAVDALAVAAAQDPDAEVRQRADGLLTRIEQVTVWATLFTHPGGTTAVVFSPDGRGVASAGQELPDGSESVGLVKLSDVDGWQERTFLLGHRGGASRLAYTPDGGTLVSGGRDGTLFVWDVASRTRKATLRGHTQPVTSLAVTPDGRTLVSGSMDATVRLWNLASARQEHRIDEGPSCAVASIAITRDGRKLASAAAGGTVHVRDLPSLRERATYRQVLGLRPGGIPTAVTTIAFSPDGQTLAAGGTSRFVQLVDVASGQLQIRLGLEARGAASLAFAPGGRVLAAGDSNGVVTFWDPRTGRRILSRTGHAEGITSVAFSRDGRWLASASFDGTVKLWDVSRLTGAEPGK
jgi:WD40 repeat protein